MITLVIFAALIYLVSCLGLDIKVARPIVVILALAGIILFVAHCLGAHLPMCLTT